VVHVVPSWRLRQRQVEDVRVGVMGCVGPCYPTFAVFNVLGIRGIVVIYPFAWADIYDPRWMGLLATS
jgi:predicted metal-binding membrane protein